MLIMKKTNTLGNSPRNRPRDNKDELDLECIMNVN